MIDKKALIAEARELGCTEITIEGVKYGIGPAPKAIAPPITDEEAKDLIKAISPFDEMSDQEILYFSTPYYDELQENKKKHAEHLKNEAIKNG
jgi:hypothetical protein